MSDDTDHTPFSFERRGILFVLSAPSGAGKTTLSRHILGRTPDLKLSISYTTRTPRPGEIDGQDYHFIDESRFVQLRAVGAFAEWAQVHGFLYGTARAPLDDALSHGKDFLLDIDVQGAHQLQAAYPEAVSVFVLPPSWGELENRLRSRGTDHEEVIARRLRRAREETQELGSYDYLIVNDNVERATSLLIALIQTERLRVSRLISASSPLLFQALHSQGRGEL
jgi:guanylate kinase